MSSTANSFDKHTRTSGVLGQTGQTDVSEAGGPSDIRLDPQIAESIRMYKTNKTPFITILDKVGRTEKVPAMYYQWMEQWPLPNYVTVTAVSSQTSITVDLGDIILPQMTLLHTKSGMQSKVTAVSSNTLTLTNSVGETPTGTIAAGDTLALVAVAGEEGQMPFEGIVRNVDSGTMYLQETGVGLGITEWAEMWAYRGINEMDRVTQLGVEQFKAARERKMLLSNPGSGTGANSMPQYYQAGLRWYCQRYNRTDFRGNVSYDGLVAAVRPALRWSSTQDMAALGSLEAIDRLINIGDFRERQRTTDTADRYGFNLRYIDIPSGGRLMLIPHEMLEAPGLERELMVFSWDDLTRKEFYPYKLTKGIQPNGQHGKEWELRIADGLDHRNPRATAHLMNL